MSETPQATDFILRKTTKRLVILISCRPEIISEKWFFFEMRKV
jgi:hypothetical protein